LQDTEQKIARPRQIYLGYRERDYVPIEQRGADESQAANA
jgi:citrate synthase